MLPLLRTSDPNGLLIGLGIFVLVLFLAYIFGVQRTKNLTAAAASFGFAPAQDVPFVRQTPLFQRNISLSNIFVGTTGGFEAAFFDLRVGQGKNSYSQTVAGFRKAGVNIPPFQLHATNLADRIAAHFSDEIIPIDCDPSFSHRYTVRSKAREECQSFFSPMVAAYFAQLPPHKLTIEGAGEGVILYTHGSLCNPSKIGDFMNETGNIAVGFFSQV